MAKTVFLSMPAHGHINPTLPVVAELVRRGEEVIYYALEEFEPAIIRTGASFRSYGEKFPIHPSRLDQKLFESTFGTVYTLLEASQFVLDNLLEEIKAHQPDYLVHDAFIPWGTYLTRILKVPSISSISNIAMDRKVTSTVPSVTFGTLRDLFLTERNYVKRSQELLTNLSERYPVRKPQNPFELFGVFQNYEELNLVYTSRMFQPFADNFDPQNFKFVGPSLLPRPEAPVFPFEALTGKPLIYISLGTIYNARPEFYRACFKAFGATAWQVVMAVGSQVSKELLGQAPGNFIIREVVPQLEVLKRASLFITHGGMNSVSEALYNNVPMVVLPQSADQPWIGKRVAELGAGQMLLKRKVSPSHLRQAAEKVLSQPSYVQAATLIGNSLRLAGGYQKAVDEIEAYKQKQGIISKHSV